jgi:hypothetical protein
MLLGEDVASHRENRKIYSENMDQPNLQSLIKNREEKPTKKKINGFISR